MDKNYNKYDILIYILIISLSCGDVFGAISPIRVLTILFSPLVFGKLNKTTYKYARPILLLFIFWFVWIMFSMLWTFDKSEGGKSIIYYFIHFLLFIEIIIFSHNARQPLKAIVLGWITAFVSTSFVALWELNTNMHLNVARFDSDRTVEIGGVRVFHKFASATFYNYNAYVTFICYSISFILVFIYDLAKSYFAKFIGIIVLVISIYIIITNASRGGLFSLIMMLIVFLSYVIKFKSNIKYFLILLFSITIFFFICFNDELFVYVTNRLQEKTDLSEEGRFSIWSSGLFVLSETLLIGTGVGGISKAMSIYTTNTVLVMHNLFIEILVEFGLICGIVVFAYMFKLYKRTFKIIDTSRQLLLKCSLYASPFYFIINSVYLLYPMTFLFFASLYVFAFYERIKVSRI